ncbi:regulatory protein, LuxR [Microbacterium esteraromaticum]|uniref:Regulatory protein, LuxR n=1 Tax=Microbacterium esteraromaticum TaxID=57043 RepID=A0A1R4K9K7_9MICO|nr:regulatory protein, LuxR [Microbacterium esteraromaticum]
MGPVGAEAATLLRQWASQTSASITWAVAEAIPDTAEDVLIIEDATSIDAAGWEQVRALRRTHPRLLIRTAVHSFRQVPPEEDAEFVFSLSLTLEETSEYLYRLASHLDPRAVHLATGGLPAAVRAVAHLKTMRSEIVDSALATLSPGPLDAELAVLAAPEALTQELVVELGGPSDFIDRAERAGWGKWTSTLEHPLFMLTAPVRAATAQAHPSDRVETVREQAGRFLLQQGAWYGALIEGAAARSLPVIDAALRGAGMPLLKMHGVSIAARLRGFHVWELRRWPIVALALALIYNARHEHRVRAVELMGVALLGARTAPSGSAERALLRVIESVLQRLLGTGDSGVKAARDGSRMIRELPSDEFQSVHGLLGDMHSHAAVSLLSAGEHAEALAEFERALATAARPATEILSLGAIAWITAHSGDVMAAQRWVQTAVARPWSDDQRNGYLGCLLRIAEAQICIEKGQLDAAENAINSVWHMIDTVEYWPLLAHVRAQIDICRGRAGVGLERLRALRRHRSARISREYTRLLDLADSGLALAAGDPVAASTLVPRASDSPLVALGAARAVMFAGQYERALRMLGSITAVSPAERTHAAVLEAVVLHRLGRASDAARAAQHAVTVAEAYELTTPFLLVPVDDRELFDIEMPWPTPTIRAGEATASLTDRECVILRELVDTASASAIADHLHVSVNTVKSQRRSLYRKLGVTSRQQALTAAVAQGLLGTRVR